jgi:cytoskeletal protein CcmA (bactofilin family)
MALLNKQDAVRTPGEAMPIPVASALPKIDDSQPMPTQPMPTQRDDTKVGGSSDLLLGAGAEFEGKLTFKGTVRIDAKFKGSIVTNDVLVVGEHARIDAEITCGTVIVQGEVNGNIKAKSAVELHRSAKVRGNVETTSLIVEKGAFLQGQMTMGTGEKPSKSAAALQ